jgi:hypothetical protein
MVCSNPDGIARPARTGRSATTISFTVNKLQVAATGRRHRRFLVI